MTRNGDTALRPTDSPHIEACISAAAKTSLTIELSWRIRQKMFALFMSTMRPTEQTTVLDVGVTPESGIKDCNYFEKLYPHRHRLTCASIEEAPDFAQTFSGVTFVKISPDLPLPFADGQFDVVFSSAVIEHVGGREAQRRFVGELVRVSRRVFLTTPNRWFPLELHTGWPLLHYLPAPTFRWLLRRLGREYWSRPDSLNLLTARELQALWPLHRRGRVRKVRLAGLPSNLVAYDEGP